VERLLDIERVGLEASINFLEQVEDGDKRVRFSLKDLEEVFGKTGEDLEKHLSFTGSEELAMQLKDGTTLYEKIDPAWLDVCLLKRVMCGKENTWQK